MLWTLRLLRQARSVAGLAAGRGEACATVLARTQEPGLLQRSLAVGFASAAEPPDGGKPPGDGPVTESEEDADGGWHGCLISLAVRPVRRLLGLT